jgi:DNA-binding LacI/PurR family transcriptional regulator
LEGGITSVSLRIPELISKAVDRLLKIIEDRPITGDRRTIVPCDLRIRQSSAGSEA